MSLPEEESARPWRRLLAAVEEAASSSWRRRGVVVATVAAIGVSLSFPVGVLVALGWVVSSVDALAARDRVRAFLAEDAGPGDVQALLDRLARLPEARGVDLVSPEQARQRFVATFPELEDVASDMSPDELRFPASVEVEIAAGLGAARRLRRSLEGQPGVQEVRHDEEWAARLERLRRGCRTVAVGVALLALGVAAFTIGNVVAIGALARREELAVLRLVGAPRFHVRAPFWIEGLVQGALGGLLAAVLGVMSMRLVGARVGGLLPGSTTGLPEGLLVALVAAPALAGALGAAVGVELVLRRHARLER